MVLFLDLLLYLASYTSSHNIEECSWNVITVCPMAFLMYGFLSGYDRVLKQVDCVKFLVIYMIYTYTIYKRN